MQAIMCALPNKCELIIVIAGHAIVAMGDKYTIVMENGPARMKAMARNIQVGNKRQVVAFILLVMTFIECWAMTG